MGRFHVKFQSATAVAVDTAVGYLMCPAGNGYNLKRVDASLITVASASAPPDQQCTLGIAPATGAPTGTYTPATGFGILNQNYPPALSLYVSGTVGWGTTQPTFGAGTADMPGDGGAGRMGIFRTIDFSKKVGDRFYATHGETIVCAIEFAEKQRAQCALSYGNSSQPGSIHQEDQLPLLVEKRLHAVWRERAEIEKNLEKREAF